MRSKGQQQQSTRRIRRERRRLGRFVAFSEMLTGLTPKPLIEPNVRAEKTKQQPQRFMKGRGTLVLEIACWFALFVLIGVIAYQR